MPRIMGRIMGIDYGERTVGIAISDEMHAFAHGLGSVIRRENEKKWAFLTKIKSLVSENDVKVIVLGLPVNQNYKMGEQGKKTLEFKEKLQNALPGISIVLRDERFTSAIAERVLLEADLSRKKRGVVIDKMAACIILQDYLDEIKRQAEKNRQQKERDNENMDDSIISIKDENGAEIDFCVIDELVNGGVRYLLVVEEENIDDDEAEAVIFKETGTDKDDIVFNELDDDEFDVVAKLFDERLEGYEIDF